MKKSKNKQNRTGTLYQSDRSGELIILKLSTELSRSIEGANVLIQSRAFRIGRAILHPLDAPKIIAQLFKNLIINHVVGAVKRPRSKDSITDSVSLKRFAERSKQKKAIVLHLYYTDMWPYFSEKLSILKDNGYDLVVSLTHGSESPELRAQIASDYPNSEIVVVQNKGRDVLPFLFVTQILQEAGYEHVLKIHSKKSPHMKDAEGWGSGDEWMEEIMSEIIPKTQTGLHDIQEKLRQKRTSVIGPETQYISLIVNYEQNKRLFRNILDDVFDTYTKERVDAHRYRYGFFAGTMFWVRLDSIVELLSYTCLDFQEEARQIDGTMAHAMERAFSVVPQMKKCKQYSLDSAGNVKEIPYLSFNLPSWSDVKKNLDTFLEDELVRGSR